MLNELHIGIKGVGAMASGIACRLYGARLRKAALSPIIASPISSTKTRPGRRLQGPKSPRGLNTIVAELIKEGAGANVLRMGIS